MAYRPYVSSGPAPHHSRRLVRWLDTFHHPTDRATFPERMRDDADAGYVEARNVVGVALAPMRHHDAGLSWTASGYGRKIPTRYMLAHADGRGSYRWHRVYVVRYGNAGSAYIIVRGRMAFLTPNVERDLETIGG